MMPKYQWIQHKGKRILFMDIASQTTEEFIDITERIKQVVIKEPPKSILCMVNVKDGKFNNEISQIIKEFAKYCEPYVKVTASVGVEGLKKIIHNAVIMFTGNKDIVLKDTKEEALDWLVEQ
jgi:hypothetical protein